VVDAAKAGAVTGLGAPVPRRASARRGLRLPLVGLCGVAFALEHALPVYPERSLPDPDTLSVLGGLHGVLVLERGEWYRLFTSPWLHADGWHLIANAVGLAIGAGVLEQRLGRAWAGALFFIGATFGALFSLALNAPTTVSVGASGAILCLLLAAFVLSFRGTVQSGRRAQFWLVFALLPSLFQPLLLLGVPAHALGIDFANHAGGALAGLICGGWLLKRWRLRDAVPPYTRAARAVATVGVVAYTLSACSVYVAYGAHKSDHSGSMRYTPPA
jgi:membrane associated rhomboid family serine protease